MPLVHVRTVLRDGALQPRLAAIAAAVAAALDDDVADTWCTFTALDGLTVGARDGADAPVAFVDVRMRSRGLYFERLALSAACEATAAAFELPIEDVWGSLALVEADHTFAGGRLLT